MTQQEKTSTVRSFPTLHLLCGIALGFAAAAAAQEAPATTDPALPAAPAQSSPQNPPPPAPPPVRSTLAAPATAAAPRPAAPSAPDLREESISLRDLGYSGSAQLRGVEGSIGLPFGVRDDEVVTAAVLKLRYTYSPSLLPELSHLRIAINDATVAALPLPVDKAGIEVERTIALDPAYFSDYNRVRIDLIGHYTRECEDPAHTSLWASISDRSSIELTLQTLPSEPDLARLPAPFFDRHENQRLELPVVLPKGYTIEMLRSAGVVASWFGALASYRSARFPLAIDALPTHHALVFATNTLQPAGLQLDDVQAPTLRVIRHPQDASVQLLVLQGADEAQLRQAAEGLVLGQAVLSGTTAIVDKLDLGTRRPAYDAPNWIRTDRPVRLGELVDNPLDLQANGHAPAPVRINLRLPPDLLTWNRVGVPIDLKYRYTPPSEADNSMLTVSLNNQLLKAFALKPTGIGGKAEKLLVPLLGDGTAQGQDALVIPAFQVSSNNQLQFQFSLDYNKGLCKGSFTDTKRAAIDADSTIDLSGFPHYAAMPNLTLFANAGYPFTKYADLAETAIVLPPQAERSDIETLLFILGRMGRMTGVPALRFQLVGAEQLTQLGDVDLLLIGGGRGADPLQSWGKSLDLILNKAQREFGLPAPAVTQPRNPLQPDPKPAGDSSVTVSADGAIAALLGFESPQKKGRSVVAVAAPSAGAQGLVVDALEDESLVGRIHGDTLVVRGRQLASFEGESRYYAGSLSWWMRLWFHLSRHPLLMLVLAVLAGLGFAFGLYGYLRRAAERRLRG